MTETQATSNARLDRRLAPVIFTATIFLSAGLLFFVQPLFARLVLPEIGGAPAVWTTAMLFFQVTLLLGYVYAHVLTRHVPIRIQPFVHLGIWAVALLFLPLSIHEGWLYDPGRSTVLQTLTLFAFGVGVPFALLSANSPLLQAWYARSGGPRAEDPYFLYGASNIGSLLALLAFPLLAEPLFGMSRIGAAWAIGFIGLGALLAASGGLAATGRRMPSIPAGLSHIMITPRQIGLWLLLSFVPSSLMLAITTKISTDLGAIPLIWVVPLSLYLLSFVIAFRSLSHAVRRGLTAVTLVSLVVLTICASSVFAPSGTVLIAVFLIAAFFCIAVFCHHRLYDSRPSAEDLTVFYVTMSVGGALGGLFNSIIAPSLFDTMLEVPLSILAAAAAYAIASNGRGARSLAIGILIGAVLLAAWVATVFAFGMPPATATAFILIVAASSGLLVFRKAALAPLAVTGLFFAFESTLETGETLFTDRSFFGSHRVGDRDGLRVYVNGNTIHGMQHTDEIDMRPTPLSYYHPGGPMAQIIQSGRGQASDSVGVLGLGVGSLACYAIPGQSWEFYEIDETVDRVARDPALFGFLSECTPDAPTHLGDARIVLRDQERAYDILYLDAYSSDFVPIHLVTKEAVQLYRDRIAKDGLLVFHISNRYYDLSAPLARIGDALGLQMAIRRDRPDLTLDENEGRNPSDVLVMSPDPDWIEALQQTADWTPIKGDGKRIWTDDFANLLSARKF
ncbi:transporter [Aestuariibius insulae]|uniref:transporter n=1 Tax=Aestuariibius insulae TaxID=2058287 RepID=UPI00345EB577